MNEVVLGEGRAYLTRKEAAEYLTRKYFRMSPASLAYHAIKGSGPRFFRRGHGRGESLYTRGDLDTWAAKAVMKAEPARPAAAGMGIRTGVL